MSQDILNSQIRTNALITTDNGPINGAIPKILVYDKSFALNGSDRSGQRATSLDSFVTNSSNFPTNILLYIHGNPTTGVDPNTPSTQAGEWATMFGGDVIINGTLFANKLRDGSGNLINFSSISYVAPANNYENVDISSIWVGGSQPTTAGEADGDLALKILENKANIELKADSSTVTTLSVVLGTAGDDITNLQTDVTSINTKITNLTTSTGLADQIYTAHGSSNFLKSSDFLAFNNNAGLTESLHNADRLLDLAIASNSSLITTNISDILTNTNSITALQTSITNLQADIDQNESDADAAIAALQAEVDQNEADADAAIAALQADVDQNEADADASIALLSGRIDTLETESATQASLNSAIAALQADVNQNEADADSAIAALQADVDQNEADADNAISLLSGRLDTLEADATTQTALNTAIAALQADVDQNEFDADDAIAALQADINQNEADADAAITALQTSITNLQADVDQNEADADSAIAALQADVDQNEADADAAIAALQADVDQNEADADAAIAALQAESTQSQADIISINSLLDLHESEIGLNVNGVLTSYANTNFIKNDDVANNIFQDTLKEAIEALDRQLKLNKDEIESNDSDISGLQSEINSTQTGAGLNPDGSYTASANTFYLENATSLRDADFKLDARIRANANAITSLGDLPATVLELTNLQSAVGVDSNINNGNFVAFNGTTFLDGITVIKTALTTLDTAIASKVSDIFELTGIDETDKADGKILKYVAPDGANPEKFVYVDASTGPQGPAGIDGRGISSVTENNDGTFTLNFTDGLNPFTTIDLTGPQGNIGPIGPQGPVGPDGPQGEAGPAGDKGDKGDQGDIGPEGPEGPIGPIGPVGPDGPAGAAATIAIGNITTGNAGTNATVTNSGTAAAAVFDFTIPKGDKGDQGDIGPIGPQGPVGPDGPAGEAGAAGQDGAAGADAPTITGISISGTTVTTTLSSGGPLSGTYSTSIGDLSDVDITTNAPQNNQVLKWNGTNFVPADDQNGGAGGGGDITSVVAGTGLDGGATTGDATINIDYVGDDNFIKSAEDGTSITVDGENDFLVLHDASDSGKVKYIKASQISTTGGTIGAAEDADYTDGLFEDFTSNTSIGTAIDRFNEVLKALAPTPANPLDQFDVDTGNGITAKLSFGASNDQSDEDPAYLTVDNSAGYAAKDLNETYSSDTSIAGSYRLGIYNGSQDIVGTLNEDEVNNTYTNNVVNFPDNAFGSADQGNLKLFVNGVEKRSIDLTSFESGESFNGNGSGFNLTAATPGKFSSESEFVNFKHRTGTWKVGAADQVNGRNYAQVKHFINDDSTGRETGFAEWVNDNNSDQIVVSSKSLTLNKSGSKYLSGIEYHTDISATYSADIDNFYKYIYSDDAITFDESPVGLASFDDFPIPVIDTDHTKQINLSSTTDLIPTNNRIINGTLQTGFNLSHPFKNNVTSASTNESVNGILLDNHPVTSTDTSTDFDDESHRLIDTANYSKENISINTYNWDSTESLAGNDVGHKTGLIVFNSRLYSPKSSDLPNNGNFTNINSNPDYSGIGADNRVWIRKFENTGDAAKALLFSMTKSNSNVNNSNSLNNNEINIQFKVPQKNVGGAVKPETNWLSVADDFSLAAVSSHPSTLTTCGDSEHNGNNLNANTITNKIAIFKESIANGDYVLVKITANPNWSGYVDSMSVNFSNVIGNTTDAPELDHINLQQTGVEGNLSFGTTNTLGTHSNYTSDINSKFDVSGDKYGIFQGKQEVTGLVNDTTAANGNNYEQYAFGGGEANTGTLKLEINEGDDLKTHEVDLSTIPFITGDTNVGGSGFILNNEGPKPARDTNNRPDFDSVFRTATFRIHQDDQRFGYNFAKITHVTSSGDEVSNTVEWINDNNTDTPDFTDDGSITYSIDNSSISSTEKNHLSGIEYYKKVTNIPYEIEVRNLYKNIYSDANDAVKVFDSTNSKFKIKTLNQSGVNGNLVTTNYTESGNVSQVSKPLAIINVANASGAQNEILKINSIVSADYIKSLPELSSNTPYTNMNDITIDTTVKHPLTASNGKTTSGASERATSSKLLQYTVSSTTQSVIEEDFSNETKRIPTGVYAEQADASGASWDSTSALTDGLMFYDEKLVYPKVDFRDVNEGGSIIAPSGNPNYSSQTGTKTFYRIFQNNTNSSQQQFTLQLEGDGSVISESLSATDIKISVKIPNTVESQTTGFLNIAKDFETDQYDDGDGALSGSLSSVISSGNTTSNTVTFGVKYLKVNEYFVMKIEADNNWTGYLSNIAIVWS